MSLVQNKVVLVTGASRGIGRAIATTFAKAGANVAFTYLSSVEKGEALEKELKKQGVGGNGQNTLDQMKQIEKQLLNKGFNNETLQKILNVKYELLKLEKALQQQGEDKKRQSETNKKEFNNQATALPSRLQEYLKSIEILNRQSLPLRSNFNQRVQEYFKTND